MSLSFRRKVKRARAPSRTGFQALKIYAPFKVIERSDDYYGIVLPSLLGYYTFNRAGRLIRIHWLSPAEYSKFLVKTRRGFTIEAIVPINIKPTYLIKEGDGIIYVRKLQKGRVVDDIKKAIDDLKNLSVKDFKSKAPLYMEFTYESLTNPNICAWRIVGLSSSKECPLIDVCALREGDGRECIHYKTELDTTFVGLYKSFIPDVREVITEEEVKHLADLYLNDRNLATFTFTEKAEVSGYLDSARLYIRKTKTWLFEERAQALYFNLKAPLPGMRLVGAHSFTITFAPETWETLISEIRSRHPGALRWILLKYWLIRSSKGERKIFPRNFGFKAFNRLYSILKEYVLNETYTEDLKFLREIQGDPEKVCEQLLSTEKEVFLNYTSFVFLHSLSHALIDTLSTINNIPEGALLYSIEPKDPAGLMLPNKQGKIYLFEDAIGGYGYLKAFYEKVKSEPEILRRLFNIIYTTLDRHAGKVEALASNFWDQANLIIDQVKDEDLQIIMKDVLRRVQTLYRDPLFLPHIMVLRRLFIHVIKKLLAKKPTEEERRKLFDILAIAPSCWDGCPLCVIRSRDCGFHQYDQIFVISRSLLKAFLDMLMKDFKINIKGVSEAIRAAITSITPIKPRPPNEIAVKELSGCLRRAYLDRKTAEEFKEEEIDISKAIDSVRGTAIHEYLQHRLKEAKREALAEDEIELNGVIIRVKGKADLVMGDEIVELKTVRFMPKQAYEDHVNQLQYYMNLLGKPKGRIVYIATEGQKGVRDFIFERKGEYLSMLKERAIQLYYALIKDEIPRAEIGTWCKTCKWRGSGNCPETQG